MLKMFKETKANLLINFYLRRRKIVHYIYANEKFFPEMTFPQIEHSRSLRNELFCRKKKWKLKTQLAELLILTCCITECKLSVTYLNFINYFIQKQDLDFVREASHKMFQLRYIQRMLNTT